MSGLVHVLTVEIYNPRCWFGGDRIWSVWYLLARAEKSKFSEALDFGGAVVDG